MLGGINNYQYAPNPSGWVDPLGMVCKERYERYKAYRAQGLSVQDSEKLSKTKPDFYVGPSGPDSTLPSTGYRYMRYENDDGTVNKFAPMTIQNKSAPTTYFGFEKYDTGIEARKAFQVKGPEIGPDANSKGSWSDARLRGEFDTLQLFENKEVQARVPYWKGDDVKTKLEPFAEAYPQYGEGGAVQLHADSRKIDFDNVDILPEK